MSEPSHLILPDKAQLAAMSARDVDIYILGFAKGLRMFAWWKDGEQYVGSCGTTLKDALSKLAFAQDYMRESARR